MLDPGDPHDAFASDMASAAVRNAEGPTWIAAEQPQPRKNRRPRRGGEAERGKTMVGLGALGDVTDTMAGHDSIGPAIDVQARRPETLRAFTE